VATLGGKTENLARDGAGLESAMAIVADMKKTTIPNSSRRATRGVRQSSIGAGNAAPVWRSPDLRRFSVAPEGAPFRACCAAASGQNRGRRRRG